MDAHALEQRIALATTDPTQRNGLLAELSNARVAIPVDKGPEGGKLPVDSRPLTLDSDQGFPVIAVFTSPDKATPWQQRNPAFGFCLVTDFDWVRQLAKPPFGIAINPGYRYSLLLTPETLQSL